MSVIDQVLVTVIMPVFNRENVVARAIRSVLEQTHKNLEFLIVDDCSTDGTSDIIEAYAQRDDRIRVIKNTKNLGPAGSRNRGIEAAQGKFVTFQDSDDRWFPEKLEAQLRKMQEQPQYKVGYCGAFYFAQEQCYYIPRVGTIERPEGELFDAILLSNPTTPQTLMIERSVFDEAGVFDASLRINEDWEFALRLAKRTPFAFVEEPLAVIYRTKGSVSSDQYADLLFREELLLNNADAYTRNIVARARQNYILGSLNIQQGRYREAAKRLVQSFRDVPSVRCILQLLLIVPKSMIKKGGSGQERQAASTSTLKAPREE
ncbi:MAG: glycosyltransferase family 2 protein [Pseudomonadota bacterium]